MGIRSPTIESRTTTTGRSSASIAVGGRATEWTSAIWAGIRRAKSPVSAVVAVVEITWRRPRLVLVTTWA